MAITKEIQRVAQNLAVQTSTIRQELTTEENKLSEALRERRLKHVSEDELKQVMLFVYALIGLRGENYPKGLDKDFLHTYIRDYYGGHTPGEIRLAFTMAIQHKLKVDATTFENFTTAYFSKVMDAYRMWAKETLDTLPELMPKKTQTDKLETAYWKLVCIDKLPCKVTL